MGKLFFILLNIILLPLYIIGVFAYMLPIILARGKVSGTTYEPYSARLFYELMGTRKDPAARMLAKGLPATNIFYRYFAFYPIVALSKLTGFTPVSLSYPAADPSKMATLMAVRTEFLDQVVETELQTVDQFVVLGAGWDTRAYNSDINPRVKLFEVDSPGTQAVKKRALDKSGLNADSITFVSCDFNKESWLSKLEENGFNRQLKTLVLWEGVSMYLNDEAISATLNTISQLGKGSSIAFDMFVSEWLEDSKLGHAAAKSVKATYGEAFTYSVRLGPKGEEGLNDFVKQFGLSTKSKQVQYIESKERVPLYAFVQAENG